MTQLGQVWAVLRRDLAVEQAGRESLVAVAPFVLAAVVLVGLGAGARLDALRVVAPAVVWLLVLAAALPLGRGVRAAEQDEDCWDLLRGLTAPVALLAGKILSLWLQLAATWALAALLAAVALGAHWPPAALLAGALGTLGVAADLALFGIVTGASSRQGGLLGVLVLPAGVPVLLAGTQLAGPTGSPLSWLALLVVYDAVALVLAWTLLPFLLEE